MANFIKINDGEVKSLDGFSIRISHKSLAYFEGKKAITIELDHVVDPYRLIVYEQCLTGWHRPFDKEVLLAEDKRKIKKRIESALKFLDIPYSIE